jgi:hypothetical protein
MNREYVASVFLSSKDERVSDVARFSDSDSVRSVAKKPDIF